MVHWLLAFIFLSSFSFADYEIHYIVKSSNKKSVRYATLYYDSNFFNEDLVKDGIKGQWSQSVVFAICNEPGSNCTSENEKRKITKVLPYNAYLAKLGEIFKVDRKYYIRIDGMTRIDKDIQSAQVQQDYELANELKEQKRGLEAIYRIAGSTNKVKPTKEEPEVRAHVLTKDSPDFRPALAPMFLAKEYNTAAVEGRFFDVYTLGEWVLADKNTVDYPTAEEKCKSMDGTLPTEQDILEVSSMLHESPIAKWADKFWVQNNPGILSSYRTEKVNLGENSYKHVTYCDFYSEIFFAKKQENRIKAWVERISFGSFEVTYPFKNRPNPSKDEIYAKSKTKAAVICIVNRS